MRRSNQGAETRAVLFREHVHGKSWSGADVVISTGPSSVQAKATLRVEANGAGNSIDAFIAKDPGAKKVKKAKSPTAARARAQDELELLLKTQNASGYKPQHFVALYEKLHVHCYGVGPSELETVEWWAALNAASRMLVRDFGNDSAKMLDFMRWAWRRERARIKKADGEIGRRMLWRWQFGPSMLTDYRVATRA